MIIPTLKHIVSVKEVEISDEPRYVADGKVFTGLEHLYHLEAGGKHIYMFDNHNHALWCWWTLSQHSSKPLHVDHIDQHSDMGTPHRWMNKYDLQNANTVFEYTNHICEVGSFIQPALQSGIIGSVSQYTGSNFDNPLTHTWENGITSGDRQQATDPETPSAGKLKPENGSLLLDLDLDYFAPEMDFISLDDRMNFVREKFEHSDHVTICTSPYYLGQKRALEILNELFT